LETPVIAVVSTCKSHALDAIANREDGDKPMALGYTLAKPNGYMEQKMINMILD